MTKHSEEFFANLACPLETYFVPPCELKLEGGLVTPTVELFEKFGISGSCEVVCKRGVVPIRELGPGDRIATRMGLRSASFLMVNSQRGFVSGAPRATLLERGEVGQGMPEKSIAVGCQNSVARYLPSPKGSNPSRIEVEMESSKDSDLVRDCVVDELCIAVFDKPTEILIQGIYVACPSFADISRN